MGINSQENRKGTCTLKNFQHKKYNLSILSNNLLILKAKVIAQIFTAYMSMCICVAYTLLNKKRLASAFGAVPVLKKQKTKTQTNKLTNSNKNIIEDFGFLQSGAFSLPMTSS